MQYDRQGQSLQEKILFHQDFEFFLHNLNTTGQFYKLNPFDFAQSYFLDLYIEVRDRLCDFGIYPRYSLYLFLKYLHN